MLAKELMFDKTPQEKGLQMRNVQSRYILLFSFIMLCLTGSSDGYAYEAGTFSIKPLNITFSSIMPTLRHKDSSFNTTGPVLVPAVFPLPQQTRTVRDAAWHKILQFGFSEGDRNGYGYGFEAGYVFLKNAEIFARAGFCSENPSIQFVVGDRSYRFQRRTNYGLSLGFRYYYDLNPSWKPYASAAFGFVSQGKATSNIYWHNPFNRTTTTDPLIGRFNMLKASYLPSFEMAVGTDYLFTPRVVLSAAIGLRYTKRGGSTVINTPGAVVGIPLPARRLVYSDYKPEWSIPVTFSLKFAL